MCDQLRTPADLTPGKGHSLPTGQEAKDIVEGVLFGAFGHPQVSSL